MKCSPPDDGIHQEIRKWKDSYIDVNKIFREKRRMAHEISELKEEIRSLQLSLGVSFACDGAS